jgi:predicted outer membrane lipoprotein
VTVEKNGSGWKVATILGALLCCAVGVIAGSSTIYLQHVTWAANKTAEVDIKLAVASSERFSLRADVNQVVLAVDSVASRMDAMTRAMERLADSNCYRDTGKPCSRTMLDERP